MSNIVKINDTELKVIEFQGQRVATLAQVDEVHDRPEGTARRTFNEHKHRLVEGEDYFVRNTYEARKMGFTAPNGLTLITEQGYTMLVKPFTDDLAWQVQRQVVTGYFRAKEAAAPQRPTKPARVRGRTPLDQVKVINFVGDALKDVPGIRLDVVAAAKLQAFEQHTGIDFSEFRRALPAVALERMVHLNPTQIGARIAEQTGRAKVSSQLVNKVLLQLGLQRKVEDGYALTEAGIKYGEVLPFKAKNAHHGNQIDWWESVVDVVRENMPAADGKPGNGGSVIPLKPRQGPNEPQAALL
ncbi:MULTISPECIES: ORF6N domain-containing protein [Delftia]|uniref:ORF6N domain-containing protein n=1 Tax=Delftia acidovorans TaxID=80866 RepID=A0A7T2W0W6_DELAC|nr:ORF6N domain-containing protein [Delftia acidovorans]QPS09658.1 ORF6N domain-containing protein [Delftia acidovorans]